MCCTYSMLSNRLLILSSITLSLFLSLSLSLYFSSPHQRVSLVCVAETLLHFSSPSRACVKCVCVYLRGLGPVLCPSAIYTSPLRPTAFSLTRMYM